MKCDHHNHKFAFRSFYVSKTISSKYHLSEISKNNHFAWFHNLFTLRKQTELGMVKLLCPSQQFILAAQRNLLNNIVFLQKTYYYSISLSSYVVKFWVGVRNPFRDFWERKSFKIAEFYKETPSSSENLRGRTSSKESFSFLMLNLMHSNTGLVSVLLSYCPNSSITD